MNFCTHCGNQLKPDARFCGKCGQTQTPGPSGDDNDRSAGQLCSKCGFESNPVSKFCISCGNPLTASPASPEYNQPAAVPLLPPEDTIPPVPLTRQSGPQQTKVENKPVKKKRRLFLKIAAAIFVFVIIALAGLYFYGTYLQEKTSDESGSEDNIIRPEYALHPVVNGTTTEEMKEITVGAGQDASVLLSDSCSVLLMDLKSDTKVMLKKESNTMNPGIPGIETSGYMISLTVQMSDGKTALKPVITIPRSQAGDINPATLNILRVSDLLDLDGNLMKDQKQLLPVSIDEKGNFTAVDNLFPLTAPTPPTGTANSQNISSQLAELFFPKVIAQTGRYNEGMATVANVKYCIVTFQGHTNWSKNPRLVQMTPDKQKAYYRHPATGQERSERKQPVVNIIVMVHGHNEEEKGGYVDNAENGIWEFGYKRDVWNYMYQYYLEEQEKARKTDVNKPENCTLFYEFMYPSYRPIYTPVPANSINRHQTLGEDLGEALNKELLENNPQVAKMIKENIPFNLFIVGHSMGGLVARAGLRSLDLKLLANFRQLITWGSPHQGSPVTTLRYITAAGFDISIDGLPFYPYDEYPSEIMKMLAMDTPGTRDLRWTNGSKGFEKFFDYDKFFRGNRFTDRLKPEVWDLRTGTAFYNENLKVFNESEKFANKYTFLTGSTSKIAQVKKCNFLLTKAYYLLVKASDCAKGSYIIKLLAGDDTYRNNDGASPVYGQGGQGLWPRPRAVDMGDMDHEEFYEGKGRETAARTFYVIKENAACNCPVITDYNYDNSIITAKLVWPSDPNPGKQIDRIEVVLLDAATKKVLESSSDFTFNDHSGSFKGKFTPGNLKDNPNLQLQLVLKTKAGAVVESEKYAFIPAGTSSNFYGIFEGTYKMQVNEANILEDFLSRVGNTGDASLDNMDKNIARSDYENFMENVKKSNTDQVGALARFEVGLHSSSPGTYIAGKTQYYVYNKQIGYLPVHLAPLQNKSNKAKLETRSDGFTSEVDEDGRIYKLSGNFRGNKLEGEWKVTSKKTGKILWTATFSTTKTLDL